MAHTPTQPALGWPSRTTEKDGEGQGSIAIRDLAGRTIATLMMNGQQGQQVWDTREVAPGTYLVQYLGGSGVLYSEKLIIQQ
ncbi:MAG: T9SS type A sorting domain-containing protein [Flavobacteriales bacterium]|nr:T9SS type A sorting domain-containing protein [Flavobacteriales bacterium]